MPTIEITPDGVNLSVPIGLNGNIGFGTTMPQYPLHITNVPLQFGINQTPIAAFQIGLTDARYISCSGDGNIVVVGKASNSTNGKIFVNTYNGSLWSEEQLNLTPAPSSDYPSGTYQYYGKSGARGYISNDGTRILAVRGLQGTPNANSATIFEKINNVWTSNAFLHRAGSFGWGSAISGDGNTIALTAPYDYTNNYAGYVYAFKYNASTQTWDETLARSYENWPDQISLNFDGTVLAFSRTNLPPDQNTGDPATAYLHILQYSNGAWNDANDDIIISPPNGLLNWHYYGKSLCLSGNGTTLVVGAPGFVDWGTYNVLNAVYVYKKSNGSWVSPTTYTVQPSSYSSPSANDYDNHFGNVVTINSNGTMMVIGAHASDVNGIIRAGRAWVFQFTNNSWNAVGSINGTSGYQWFGSAVALTDDSMSAYITARNWNYDPLLRGVTKYTFMAPGTALNIADGNMILTGDITVTGNTSNMGDMRVNGHVEIIGDDVAYQPVKVTPMYYEVNKLYSTATYDDFTTWSEYTNRINITDELVGSYDMFVVPDIGFDLFIMNTSVNSRNLIKVYRWGTIRVADVPFVSGTDDNELGMGTASIVPESINVSYYLGNYNSAPAAFVFYEATHSLYYSGQLCVIFQSNKITIHVKQATGDGGYGIDFKYFGVQLPGHRAPPFSITDQAYEITLQQLRSVGINVEGSIVSHSIGIGTSTPLFKSALSIVQTQGIHDHGILFDNSLTNRKITLYNSGVPVNSVGASPNNHQYYGFGINGSTLRYQVDGTGSSHVFYAATDAESSSELMRIVGNGNVGVGKTIPMTKLHVGGSIIADDSISISKTSLTKNAIYDKQVKQLTSNIAYNVTNWNNFVPVNANSPPIFFPDGGYKNGQRLVFNGTTNSTLLKTPCFEDFPNLVGIPGFTFGMQCKLTGTPSENEVLIDFGDQNLDEVILYRNGTSSSFNFLFRSFYATAPLFTNVFSNAIPQDQWFSFVIRGTYGYSNATNNLKLDTYLNGEVVTSILNDISSKLSVPRECAFGGRRDGGTSFPNRTNMTGEISAFQMFDYALSDNEIKNVLFSDYLLGKTGTSYNTNVFAKNIDIISENSNLIPSITYASFPNVANTSFSGTEYTIGINDLNVMTITSQGNVGIGTTIPSTTLTVNGTIRNINGPSPSSGTSLVITGDGDIAPQSSDSRYKTNVEDLPSVINSMMNLRAVSYNWKDEPQKWYGLLAQQVSEVFPDAAWHNIDNDTYGVHYTPTVITLLLKAIQEQQQMIENQNQRITALENQSK